jgi:polar amino acid transport system substrate-binding protein
VEMPEAFSIYTSANGLTQILMNLLSNAIDAIPDKGKIKISNSLKNNQVLLLISDTGIGIESNKKNHIFDLGYSNKKSSHGTGFGLYIVKELCASLNISISFESVLGKGTTFTLHFPLGEHSNV